MQLLLTSSFNTVVDELRAKQLVPEHAIVAFIPTAGDPYPETPWIAADRTALLGLGYELVDVDLKGNAMATLRSVLESVDIIFVAGGNTTYLAFHAQRSGFASVIRDVRAQGKVYIGSSAGSILAGPTVVPFVQSDIAELPKDFAIEDPSCLGFVDAIVLPHDQVSVFAEEHDKIVVEYADRFSFIRLTDDEYRVIEVDSGV